MRKIILLFTCLLLVSCGKSVKMNDLQYKEGKGKDLFVYQEGKPYNGVAWDDDGKSYYISVDCGLLREFRVFIPDGKLFYSYEDDEKYYNENGNEITKHQARELYPEKYKQMKELMSDANNIINSNTIREEKAEDVLFVPDK